MKITLNRKNENYLLEAKNENGNTILIDNSSEHGGENSGFRPMQMLLAALGGCSSMDIISILKKQRIDDFQLNLTINGKRESGNDANLWKAVHVTFTFSSNVPKEKAERAVQLSIEKYCSVSKTLEAAGAAITYDVIIS
ncbi:MAG: OsmC family protein [Bacteroidetes bacterium]|nr:OsmC family protein [Bacteroidota bacterium]